MTTQVLRRAPGSPRLASSAVRQLGDLMLEALGLTDAELSVLLTNDARIRILNRRHRDKDKPTDVLSFPLEDETQAGVPRLLGDVVISLDTALRQARSRRRPLLEEVRFLLAHGLLHLLGHDHGAPAEKRLMDAATRRLVRAAPIPAETGAARPAGTVRGRRRPSRRRPKARKKRRSVLERASKVMS